jgi:hypothetical protein
VGDVSDDYRADPASVQATSDLVDAVPVLRPILDEHAAYHGEVIRMSCGDRFATRSSSSSSPATMSPVDVSTPR